MTNKSELPEGYKIGWVPFVHTNIYLDSHPLIPRTETEYWVDIAIQEIKRSGIAKPRVLDLCAGSGCIGVAVAKDIPDTQVDFIELDTAHHYTIEKNLRENGVDLSRTRIFGGDLFENIVDKYDFILSNPPYIDKELNRVEESVKSHEPALALYGGQDGLEVINRILTESPKYLNPGGTLYLEHEPEQVENLSHNSLYLTSHPDQFAMIRYSRFGQGPTLSKLPE